jgi:guanylate kinase
MISMIKTKKQGLLIVLSGPSGSGKNTVCDALKLKNKNIWESISMTSRKPRTGEIDGESYYFVSNKEFEKNINDNKMLEFAKFAGNYYGTPKENIEKHLNDGEDVILVIEIQGALQIKQKIPNALFIFLLPPSMKELKRRLTMRNTETQEKLMERFKTAYNEINELSKYNYVIVNDNVDEACDKLGAIIKAERCRVDRIEEVFLDNPEEKIHEKLIDKEFDNDTINLK